VRNPTISINGMAIGMRPNSPSVNHKSVSSMAISIISIEIKDMPSAVFKASEKFICPRMRIKVSRMMLVMSPLIRGQIKSGQYQVDPIATEERTSSKE